MALLILFKLYSSDIDKLSVGEHKLGICKGQRSTMETPVNSTVTESAIAEWVTILGESGVVASGADDFGASTIGTMRSIPAVLCPENQEQVAAVLQVAQRWHVGVYPVSTGNNWGYGSANPVEDGCVILDLSRLDRISDFDPELGVVTVEPGVTQGALRDFLDSHEGDYLVPVTGAGPNCSILGNALERGTVSRRLLIILRQ